MKALTEIESIPDNQVNWDLEIKRYELKEHVHNVSKRDIVSTCVILFAGLYVLFLMLIITLASLGKLTLPPTSYLLMAGGTAIISPPLTIIVRYIFASKTH